MKAILERLRQSGAQFIAICGKNEGLREELKRIQWPMPVFVEGYTNEIPYYMHLSDFLIGKPGPGSVSEALAMKLPVIVESNAWTLPQERFNAQWITEKQVGMVLPNFNRIAEAVSTLLSGDTLEHYKRNAAALENRAVFEIPPILEKLMEQN
jgi:1,2-diacylglycerol 3-beta-galactosyltransferase